ncbi:hypothetical protein SEA_GARDENSTATE_63 [Microbacterium phage GardenState]|uniref:Uncharacterized protein n=1 Tax=Microbacterium phage GardenState TaxID=2776841 RepID=A0A7L8ZDU2_9CAUD|nr:hypothetical protein SEA_GARDENSTATE_63 [Microbacterium phage GardenState]
MTTDIATQAPTKIATRVKSNLDAFRGEAHLYHVTDGTHEAHVVVSGVFAYSGPETYIFPADEEGNVLDWMELPGSFQGDIDHERALRDAGFTINVGELVAA